MNSCWYYSKGGRMHGPMSRSELDECYDRGEIANTDQVRMEGGTPWIPYSTVARDTASDGSSTVVVSRVERVRGVDHVASPSHSNIVGTTSPPPLQPTRSWLNAAGVHPLVALCVVAFDFTIFGGEAATGGLGAFFLAPLAGMVVFGATILVQRHGCHDSWAAAAGKALLLGFLTAIPTPLPSFVTAALGGMGYLARRGTT